MSLWGDGEVRFVLVSDLDHTMVDHDDPQDESLRSFNTLWSSSFAKDSLLIFSTGRSPALFEELKGAHPLLVPNLLVCSVGTEIFHFHEGQSKEDERWARILDEGWDRSAALEVALQFGSALAPQVDSEQRPHKISFHVNVESREEQAELVEKLGLGLTEVGLKAKIIFSGGKDLDIIPIAAGKGKALEFILGQLREEGRYPKDGVQVNGDSGNDIEMFEVDGVRSCVVSNAHTEVREWCDAHKTPSIFQATKRCAAGIMEALEYFGSEAQDH
ncbi:unnamed protein product [Ostreobium quekettii]|uniref:Sucrose-phosphatase n=1 Tax=Ostreobium quekettii TaxID=121088 RepID=A0A8S1IZ81_9CHLO|nr:unnamed protein product [Ostreobium quekettii]